MSRFLILGLVILACMVSTHRMVAESRTIDVPEAEQPIVAIELTAFEASEEALRLEYRIVNVSQYEVWVCDGLEIDINGPIPIDCEIFMDADGQTLMLRRRLDVPMEFSTSRPLQQKGRYQRLNPGEERLGSILRAVPIEPRHVLASMSTDPALATRVVLEIGYHSGYLPGEIHNILELAEKLGRPGAEIGYSDTLYEYFGGFAIARAFGGLDGFSRFWQEGSDEITIPWLYPALKGEPALRLVVDSVSIPYGG